MGALNASSRGSQSRTFRPWLECLEDRVLLSAGDSIGNAFALTFTVVSPLDAVVRVTENLNAASGVQLNQIELDAGDLVTVQINTSPYGGGLDSYLRVFQWLDGGLVPQIASNDNYQGKDAGLTFQASESGVYFVGISSFENTTYDPLTPSLDTSSTHGLFDLTLSKTSAAPAPILVGSSFSVSQPLAAWGDTITVHYTLENRGTQSTAPTTVSLLLSASNRFDSSISPTISGEPPVVVLAPGESYTDEFTLKLGDVGIPLDPFSISQEIFLGLQLGMVGPSSPSQGNDWTSLQLLTLEPETATTIALNSQIREVMLPGQEEDNYQIVLTEPGNLVVQADAFGPLSITLYDAQGQIIVQSDGQSGDDSKPLIRHGLTGSTENNGTVYFIKVSAFSDETQYTLTTLFTPSVSTLQTVPLIGPVIVVAKGDFNGDGSLDLATATQNSNLVTILLGDGTGSFRSTNPIDAQLLVETLAVGDFTGDGRLDLLAANSGNQGVSLLIGNGDGTFLSPSDPLDVHGGTALAVGDFTGDGNLDVAYTYRGNFPDLGTVTVLIGNGNGTFQSPLIMEVSGAPVALATSDFDGDGKLDLAVALEQFHQVKVLLGNGDGTFGVEQDFDVGTTPVSVAIGDFNGDKALDLAVANARSDDVTILLGDGHGQFEVLAASPVVVRPDTVITGDFDGNGVIDLAVTSSSSNRVTVLLGQGNGSFLVSDSFVSGIAPETLIAADINEDGRVDLAVANRTSQNVVVLLGAGDGTFPEPETPNTTGPLPFAVATGDFNGDQRPDLAVANRSSGDVSILLRQGDGTFQGIGTVPVGTGPVALAVGDFNGDGRLDLAVANYTSENATILLGNGDGSFLELDTLSMPGGLSSVVARDFNEDGNLDLAIAIRSGPTDGVVVLRGNGDGTFDEEGFFATGAQPIALVAGDFTGEGHLDLATADYESATITILLGDGQGNFVADDPYPIPVDDLDEIFGARPLSLVVGDFDGDTSLDLAFGSRSVYYGNVGVLLNDGTGNFIPQEPVALDTWISSLVVGDFTGDGDLDVAAVGSVNAYIYTPAHDVKILVGNGDGSFQTPVSFQTDLEPTAVAAGDFNGDARLDLAVANGGSATVTTLLGTGTNVFLSSVLAPSPVQSTPILAALTGSQLDALVLSQSGQILFRRGVVDQPGTFAPPVVLNPNPQQAARDLALVQTEEGGTILAALSANTAHVFLYQPTSDGTFIELPGFDLPDGFLYSNLASAVLTTSGLGDLVFTASASDPLFTSTASAQIFVALQSSPGDFGPIQSYSVGVNPSDIELVDVNVDTLLDLVATDRFSGQVSLLLNTGNGDFASEERFRAGIGPYALTSLNGVQTVQSLEGTNGFVLGEFDGRPGLDLLAINRGSSSFSLLSGNSEGGFLNPDPTQVVFTGVAPVAIVAGQFTTGDENLDLAILRENETLSVYRGNGMGGFDLAFTVEAGNRATGLTIADVSRPGGGGPDSLRDLLVGNAFGDLLILTGNGDGTFSPYRRADQTVSLAVADTLSTGDRGFFFSNQGDDQLAFRSAARGTARVAQPTVYQDRSAGIQSPGPTEVVTVQDKQYLVVVNTGGNNLLIYTLGPDGQPDLSSKQTYFTGTSPAGLTIASLTNDLNQDAIPDVLVANEGSNDVSVFLGKMVGDVWTLTYRPRQSSGGLGPTSVALADVTNADGTGSPDGLPDLLVSNSQSNQVSLLPDRGNGFFINQDPAIANALLTGSDPRQIFVSNFDGTGSLDLVTINRGSNDVTLIANFMTAPVTTVISSGGLFPASAVIAEVNNASALLVANAGSGTLGVLLNGPSGFEMVAAIQPTELPHLADLALVTAGNELEVYGTDTGREVAVLLGTFGSFVSPTSFLPASPGFPGGLEIITDGSDLTTPSNTPFLVDLRANLNERVLSIFGINLLGLNLDFEVFSFDGVLSQAKSQDTSTTSRTGSDESNTDDKSEKASLTTGANPPLGKAAEILLLNLGEQESSDRNEKAPEGPAQKNDGEVEPLPPSNLQENPTSMDWLEIRTSRVDHQDLYWQSLGDSLTMRRELPRSTVPVVAKGPTMIEWSASLPSRLLHDHPAAVDKHLVGSVLQNTFNSDSVVSNPVEEVNDHSPRKGHENVNLVAAPWVVERPSDWNWTVAVALMALTEIWNICAQKASHSMNLLRKFRDYLKNA